MSAVDAAGVRERIAAVARDFAGEALQRGQREHLDRADFAALANAGFLRAGLPVERGGLWRGLEASVRDYAGLVRTIADGDPSVALVAAMHPLVLCYWLAVDEVPAAERIRWQAQLDAVYGSVEDGHWWGTLTSEPGSGGDILRTRTLAEPDGEPEAGLRYRLSGEKHFGSGAGIASFMTTTALVPGHAQPPVLYMDMRGVPWDGSTGLKLLRAWDGQGMRATQSHAFMLQRFPATCIAVRESAAQSRLVMGPMLGVLFAAVAVSIVTQAMRWARPRVQRMQARAYEQSEWVRAENEAFLIEQAFEGALRAAEAGASLRATATALQAKLSIAGLAETLLLRLGRVVGGASFSRSQPIGQWAADVRALGFLRPPWGLAIDQLFAALMALQAQSA